MLSTRDPRQNKGHIPTDSEGLEKIFHTNGDQKKAGVAILITDKIDFEIKAVRIQHHQTSSSTNAKGSSLDRKHRKDL